MVKTFFDTQRLKPLLQVSFCILLLIITIVVIEFSGFIIKELFHNKETEPIRTEEPKISTHIIPETPFRFDPNSKSSTTPITQFVLLSFDGSKSINMWKETLSFADEMRAQGKKINFTYFVNSIYFLAEENKLRYVPPYGNPGASAIGYAESMDSINERVKEVNIAIDKGHEIASHATGHWSGGIFWNVEDWLKEFNSFDDIFFNVEKNNPQIVFTEKLKITRDKVRGFRAPELSVNDNMYTALSKSGFYYDSSGISYDDEWPTIDKGGVWHIPIPAVYFSGMRRSIIAVDYSIWVNQTDGLDVLKQGSDEWNLKLKDLVDGYFNHFLLNYYSNKAPMIIDHHFSKWNDGLYWEAMKGRSRMMRPAACTLSDSTSSGLMP